MTTLGPDGTVLARRVLDGPGNPDLEAVDEVARLALGAQRLGGALRIDEMTVAMNELLELAGLSVEALGVPVLGVEVQREAEGGEESLGIHQGEEEAHLGDAPV